MEKLTQLKTFEDACKIEKLNPKKVLPDFSAYPKQDQASMIAHAKLVIIVRAANKLANKGKVWKPDFDNSSQRKYEVWMVKGSSGFRCNVCDFWYSYSGVGSRLCFISSEVGEYVARTFEKLYNEYFL